MVGLVLNPAVATPSLAGGLTVLSGTAPVSGHGFLGLVHDAVGRQGKKGPDRNPGAF